MSFALDRYQPMAFHTHPALMRAAEAGTEVIEPIAPIEPVAVPIEPVAAPIEPAAVPVAAYLVGIDATAVLRQQLADFLDAAGSRRDVRVSVGVAGESTLEWVLRDAVPYGVRAMPRYPDLTSAADPDVALGSAGEVLLADASSGPDGRRQLLVLVWERPPAPIRLPGPLASALVLHCVDAVLPPTETDGRSGQQLVLSRSRPGPRPALLGHVGRLLDSWVAFAAVPTGLVLSRLAERS